MNGIREALDFLFITVAWLLLAWVVVRPLLNRGPKSLTNELLSMLEDVRSLLIVIAALFLAAVR